MRRVIGSLGRIAPAAALVAVIGGVTVLMARDGGGGGAAPSVADPHPAAGSFVADDTSLADCAAQACYEQAFGNIVFDGGPRRAFAVFDRELARGGPIEAGCHRIAHYMGAAALARYEGDVGKAFSHGSASCWSGYYHGILEWSFEGVPGERLGIVARELCSEVREQGTFLTYQCVHGLGHGLMITTGYELPDALGACAELQTSWDRKSCRGGVFMENIATGAGSPIEVTGEPRWLREDDLLYPCNHDALVPEEAKDQCYVLVTSRVLQANGYDFGGAARWCHRAEPRWVDVCFQSLGRDSSGFSTYDRRETVRLCRAAGRLLGECLWGAVRDFTSRFAGGEEAARLCDVAPAWFNPRCFEGIGTIFATLHDDPAQRISACRALDRRYARDCIRGAMATA